MKTKLLIVIFLLGCLCSEIASAQAPDTLFISTSQTVHIRFASELKYVNLGDRVILAKIVDGSKDFVAVKAREAFDYCTTMSCLEATGAMHTFRVAYREHPARLDVDTRIPEGQDALPFSLSPSADGSPSASFTLEEFASMKQELYHIGTKDYGIEILCENVFYKDDVLFLLVSLRNTSARNPASPWKASAAPNADSSTRKPSSPSKSMALEPYPRKAKAGSFSPSTKSH